MSFLNKIDGWRTKVFVWIGLPVIAGIGLMMGATDLLPTWQAHNGGGTAGTFTAVYEDCGRRNCEWRGTFAADQGDDRRADVILYDAPDGLAVGGTAPARDTGARAGVFSTTGGSTYLLVTGLTLAGVAALVAWVVIIVRTVRNRRAKPEGEPVSFAPSL
ncbi:hypothetical protein O7600_20520 [Micromonospora sp. WMMA1998]|uniref:hypothetical protein n=1 Tax=Micromonospora TaxID=1873 RepID=UPI000C05B072|nr:MULTISPECIES: hypothetical protein [unclassified Micromonospora]ATO15481.1 hypothetical protein CO540_17890 [Micromonospora sp. WMMA2032]WBC13514.1 hypothetical protein O7600_20520 [Micromonospora sp. WMMA1998]